MYTYRTRCSTFNPSVMSTITALRLFDLLSNLKQMPLKDDALAAKENGMWHKYSTSEYINLVNKLSCAFIEMGIKPGDRIGLIANNRPEWNFIDFACLQTGAINVPLYPTISEHDLKHVIGEAELSYFFVANETLYQKVKSCALGTNIKEIFCIEPTTDVRSLKDLIQLGEKHLHIAELNDRMSSIKSDDLATIIYTSGTTGNPKGVMLSHRNFLSNVEATKNLAPFEHNWRALSFLPLNHVYERMLSYLYLSHGVSVYYAESLDTIGANLKEVKPHIFVTVPRLLEKVYDKIVSAGAQLSFIKRTLFFWAVNLGLRYEQFGANGFWYEFKLKIANKIIFSKWREALGGNIACIVSGGSALQPRLARIFHAAKIKVLEGYGLTETSPVIAVNSFEEQNIRFGTVGKVINNVQLKFAADGEICVKGPNVMLGYYKHKDLDSEIFDSEGWFHTGDIGEMGDGEFLKITDRKKEMFKTSGGKYITPQYVENKLKESRFIEQVMIVGENEKFPAALIVPAFTFLQQWCEKRKIAFTTNEEMIKHPEILSRLQQELDKANEEFPQYEKIKRMELLPHEWTIEKGELTPKLSLKRKIILANNKAVYDKIYSEYHHI